MEFSTQASSPEKIKTAAIAAGVYAGGKLSAAAQALDAASGGALRAVIKTDFKAKAGSTMVLRHLTGVASPRVVLVGLGDEAGFNAKGLAAAHRAAAQALVALNVKEATSTLAELDASGTPLRQRARLAAIAVGEATYRYDATFGKPDPAARPVLAKLTLLVERADIAEAGAGLREGLAIAGGMSLARELGNLPGNICTPTYLGDTAKSLARTHKLKVQVLEQKQIEALKMGSFLSVSRGSDQPPRFIVLHYQGAPAATGRGAARKAAAPYVLVGKGITFDTGGISIKPAATMDEMKYDMCGAASVFGTLQAVAELQLPIDVIGLIPASENMPNGRANKPGDVVTSMSGQTIEILNTDAEGRLVLCDALTYAERFKPAAVIDIATLTGACVVALGHVNSGLFSTDDALADELLAASRGALDPAWRMPIQDEYQEQLKSNFADIANIGGPPGGSVTAACFLSRFTKAYPWAHLDIAGTAWKGGKDKGATGRPVPLLVQYLIDRS